MYLGTTIHAGENHLVSVEVMTSYNLTVRDVQVFILSDPLQWE